MTIEKQKLRSCPLPSTLWTGLLVSTAQENISLKEEKKKGAYNTRCSQAVTHPGTDLALLCLTSVIGREPVYS